MAGYHSYIGYPWIIDYLARYDSAAARQKPVPGQVVEFLRMPDCQYPEAVINISDQKYYIRAVITKKAQQILESEDEHFTLADIKNKIIILKNFSVCFTAVDDLRRCEFYLTVEHFSVLPMETNTVDILNCNMEPGVQKKIKELWQNYMTELEINENSTDMNLSDVSLTQLLMVASEEKFHTLKSIAEKCLELDPSATRDNPPQTFWSIERTRSQETTERLVIPVDLLLIPPHEEAVLEEMAEFRYEGQCPSEVAESSEEDNSSQPYSTALSTLSEETIEVEPSSQSGNPWNKLNSLCISVPPSLDSQPKCSHSGAQKRRESEVDSDQDSSTPDIFTSVADISMDDSCNDKIEIFPLLFTGHVSNPQQPSTSKTQPTHASSEPNPHCRQGNLNTSIASVSLTHLTQDSVKDLPQRRLSVESTVHVSPMKSYTSEMKSNPESKSDDIDREKFSSPRTRKASKRKQTLEDLESTLSDLEQQEPEYVDRPDCLTTTLPSAGEIDKVSDNGGQTAISKHIEKREAAVPVSGVQKNHKSSNKRIKRHKPILQFVCNTNILATKDSANDQLTAKGLKTSKVCIQEAPAKERHGQSLPLQAKEKIIVDTVEVGTTKLAHRDGSPFQYKYKPPSEELCACVNAIQMPADLCDWAVKMLSEVQEKVL
ncbi:adrenocortical dysplasia protein homolog isoform X1 [Bufo gargarizans]|uniref:adrenocortical dysplasia protein homolog isoform X1 n=2 Tax=Bufo gargarizans TaxID=30331 RepID=UPI001CF531C4|nr:adrenocortical dysplasia protein homolog isoform X1 [Bufo gargarizans]